MPRPLRDRTSPGVDSLRLLIDRATDRAVPERRFVSARQFAEQLSGVIRQVVAAPPTSRQYTRASALFGSMTEPLHGGLGAARPLDHWVTADLGEDARLTLSAPFSSPSPRDMAAALPTPLADPDETFIAGPAESWLAESRSRCAGANSARPTRHWPTPICPNGTGCTRGTAA